VETPWREYSNVTTSVTTDVTHAAEPFVTLDLVWRADDPVAPDWRAAGRSSASLQLELLQASKM
jgi:hypothetical protein